MSAESGFIDDACSRFEAAWQTGQQPRIEDFLPAELPPGAALRDLLMALVRIDLEWRWKVAGVSPEALPTASGSPLPPGEGQGVRAADSPRLPREGQGVRAADSPHPSGEGQGVRAFPPQPRLSDYAARYPSLGPVEQLPTDLIVDEYYARRRYGDRPTHAEYLDAFGAFHPRLANRLQAIDDGAVSDLLDPSSKSLPEPSSWQPQEPKSRQTGDDTTPWQPQPAPEASTGHPDRIGRYRIERVLGQGAFGTVYRGYDDELKRPVAIKVPHRHLVARPEDMDLYLEEAQVVAGLDHANIVPVHDVGRTEDRLCYVVSKFIEGSDLAGRIRENRLSHCESAGLVAAIAEALHHAHLHQVVHRDVKPANILIDAAGKPYLADFGLALKEEDFGGRSGIAGTAAYMSPEQARGESHLVDGRADIFSLGVVFYELLAASRPFGGANREEVIERIRSLEARPPRQLDDSIPRELERICLKALSKRASDRYTTALDMAEDLRHFLLHPAAPSKPAASAREGKPAASAREESSLSPGPTPAGLDSGKPTKIVPKGLRSFDAQDADFFLELLPGPRDRDGLPESIRFWKYRIEETNSDKTFRVGLIYGPSGCGKSSLVKAGLLPGLAGHVLSIYVEATADDTEARLLRGLRKQCPCLQENLALKESIAALRRGHGIPAGKKVLVVLDQFEQWLHAKKNEANTELVEALRQCDGERVQCIVMVRDDFWLAVSRFMKSLDIRIIEGQNSALVDVFDLLHSRKVLMEFGKSFGRLPKNPATFSQDQERFLDQSVEGLAQEGRIICIRLALYAEMVKGKPWTPTTLRAVGGMEGVGVAFLEDTFSATTAPPEHRFHQGAALSVLKILLPEAWTSLKGHMRSRQELLEASGYAERPTDFEELLLVLDNELRLITPADPEGIGPEVTEMQQAKVDGKCYQLTHDYLVPSIREWLIRKQRETRQGRAELRLGVWSSVWNAKPENRNLPSWWEWLGIRWFTDKKKWTEPQRKMMGKAGRVHGIRWGIVAAMLVVASIVGVSVRHAVVEKQNATRAEGLMDALVNSDSTKVPDIVTSLEQYRKWADPLLKAKFDQAKEGSNQRLNMALALLPVDATQVEYLYTRLLDAVPNAVPVIRDALGPYKDILLEKLWAVVEAPDKGKESQRLRAASALAKYDPDNQRWGKAGILVDNDLVRENPVFLGQWNEIFRPVKNRLLPRLCEIFRDHQPERTAERSLATNLLSDYAADQPNVLADLVMDADEKQFAIIYPKLKECGNEGLPLLQAEIEKPLPETSEEAKEALANRQANAAVALLKMNHAAEVWPLLKQSPDPRVRSWLIHKLGPLGADPRVIVNRLGEESDVTIRRALVLGLGEFGEQALAAGERDSLVEKLRELYRNEPDPGLHAAAEWLLRQWKQEKWLKHLEQEWAKDKRQWEQRLGRIGKDLAKGRAKPQWYVTSLGQTMVVIPGPVEFLMGSPPTEVGWTDYEQLHRQRIGHTFAIAAKAVTVEQFKRFMPSFGHSEMRRCPELDCPIFGLTWYEAAEYCNWLSRQEGLPEKDWCYEPNTDGKYAEGMKMSPDFMERSGYRLATEAEWEYACRAGAVTSRYYGQSEELLPKYGWYLKNSGDRSWPVGSLKPNDFGLFDMNGNVYTWCQDRYARYAMEQGGKAAEDREDGSALSEKEGRVLRGGGFYLEPRSLRSAYRNGWQPGNQDNGHYGFRPARTYN